MNNSVREHYAGLLREHGHGPRALGWSGHETQERRFEVLAGIGDLGDRSILDVGCGLADFYRWLTDRGITCQYSGIDVTEEMILRATRVYPGLRLIIGDPVVDPKSDGRTYDYVLASGILTFHEDDGLDFVRRMVERFLAMATLGIGFNCLSAWASKREEGEFYADPLEVVKICRSLSDRVVLRHDYHPGDFTIYLYK